MCIVLNCCHFMKSPELIPLIGSLYSPQSPFLLNCRKPPLLTSKDYIYVMCMRTHTYIKQYHVPVAFLCLADFT